MVVGDSRCKDFDIFEEEQDGGERSYDVCYLCQRGGKIEDLIGVAVNAVEKIDAERLVLVYVAAGINNLTVLNRQTREVKPSDVQPQTVLNQLGKLKNAVLHCHPKSIVIYCTIPPLNFRKYAEFQQSKGRGYGTKSESTLRGYTDQVIEKLQVINKSIIISNSIPQQGIKLITPCLHSNCVQDKNRNKFRLVVKALYDGLHPTRETALSWFNRIHRYAVREVEQI